MNMQTISTREKVLFWLLTVVLGCAPFFRGVFFLGESISFSMIVACLMLFFLYVNNIYKKNAVIYQFPGTLMDYAVLTLLLAYLITAFTAVKPAAAVEMFLKLATVTLIYLIGNHVFNKSGNQVKFLSFIYFSGVIVALLGLAGYAGLNLPGLIYDGRISSTFQYPNVLGTYLSIIVLIGFSFTVTLKSRMKFPVSAGNIIVLLALIGSASRGAFLVLPFAIIVLVIGYHKSFRLRLLATIIYNVITAVTFSYFLSGALKAPGKITIIVIGAILTNMAFELGLQKISGTILEKLLLNRKKALLAGAILVIIAGAIIIVNANVLPKDQMLTRITTINFSDRNVVERGYFYKDALKIIKDHPLLGVGGGGWAATYKQYQSYGYHTTQVHNFYLQTWVETGLLGLLALITFIVAIIQKAISLWRSSDETERTLGTVVLSGIIIIALHSAIDFTLAYGSMMALLWIFLGWLNTTGQSHDMKSTVHQEYSSTNKIRTVIFSVVTLVILLISLSMFVSLRYENAALASLKANNIKKMNESLLRAAVFNPLRPQLYSQLARNNFYLGVQKRDKTLIEAALKDANKAVALDRANQDYHLVKANVLFFEKRIDQAVKEVELAYSLNPWDQSSFEVLTYMYATVGQFYATFDEKEKAKYYLNKTLTVPVTMKRKIVKLDSDRKKIWASAESLPVMTPKMADNVKTALKLMEKLK